MFFGIASAIILAADIYLHHKLAPNMAVNVWGYRGKVLGRKQAAEKRILMIGPGTVFSVGVLPEEALPAQREQRLQARVSYPVRVANLGFPGEDAFAYKADLEDFLYLKPDAVIFYGDSNPYGAALPIVLRRLSPVFRVTGYFAARRATALAATSQSGAHSECWSRRSDADRRRSPTAMRRSPGP